MKVEGKVVSKPSFLVKDECVEVDEEKIYVSRSAWKLKNYLTTYNIPVKNKKCIDIGSSTGGFTEVLLEYYPKSVTCVDTGREQLHNKLRENPLVKVYEECDIRNFSEDSDFDIVVSDVSFISLTKIIEKIDKLAKETIILLFKPQFEVGLGVKRDRKGVVKDTVAIEKSMLKFEKETEKLGWKILNKEQSSILGKEGNIEFIYQYSK